MTGSGAGTLRRRGAGRDGAPQSQVEHQPEPVSKPRWWPWRPAGAGSLHGVRQLDSDALHAVVPPIGSRKFWVVQGLVVVIFLLHQLAAGRLGMATFGPMAHLAMVSLFLIPILYAALNFGFVGSVATACFMTVLMGIDLAFDLNHLPTLVMGEHVLLVGVLDVVSVFVGQRVEAERRARRRAEVARAARASAEERYRSLFELGSSPVMVLDHRGLVEEANGAAVARFGDARSLAGRQLGDLIGTEAARRVVRGDRVMVTAASPGGEVLLRPKVTVLQAASSGRHMLQVVFQDVTEEVRRHQRAEAYSRSVIEAQEDERRRIAAEIHDEPLQTLIQLIRQLDFAGSALAAGADGGENVVAGERAGAPQSPAIAKARVSQGCDMDNCVSMLASSRATAEHVIGELREIMKGLRPPALDDLGLTASVRQLVADLEVRSGIRAELHAQGPDSRLQAPVEVAMFRIAQESLANVERHADARSVIVRLAYGASEVRLSVEDDGRGFDPPEPGAGATGVDGQHLGIIGMTERASLLGGRLELFSAPGQGARVVATIPIGAARLRPSTGALT